MRRKGEKQFPVDHIVPRRLILLWKGMGLTDRGPDELPNLMTLCPACHSVKTVLERRLITGDLYGFTRGALPFYKDKAKFQAAFNHLGLSMRMADQFGVGGLL